MNNTVKLIWATPDIDAQLAYIARVSNPNNQENENIEGLLRFMLKNGHVSPFDMCNVCVELNTTRDIGRQALRHWSIKPQEFSQRYADVGQLGAFVTREFRLQDTDNRQASIDVPTDDPRHAQWQQMQVRVLEAADAAYDWCLKNGGAKEVARVVLPEGLTPTRMYFNGSVRSWLFYLKERLAMATQKEHRLLAQQIVKIMFTIAPITFSAFLPTYNPANESA